MYIHRQIEDLIRNSLNQARIVILYGARQVGKTTLLKNLFPKIDKNIIHLACDQIRIQDQLVADDLALKQLLGEKAIVIFDEMQSLPNPGLILKIIYDHMPGIMAVATGSASFDLANKLSEPLTGRHHQFQLFPFSFSEISKVVDAVDLQSIVQESLIVGSYPKIFNTVKMEDKVQELLLLADNYLYKDILTFDLVKNSHKVRELLIAVALQLGNEVSYNELGRRLGMNYKTIERYLDLLEKSFVIFRLHGFSRNLRKEITRKVKIYFYDCGIRNALINNFNPLSMRADGGALFENYIISELVKKESLSYPHANFYFWRTHSGQEIDFIADKNGKLTMIECKLSRLHTGSTAFDAFTKSYPGSEFKLITLDDFNSVKNLLL